MNINEKYEFKKFIEFVQKSSNEEHPTIGGRSTFKVAISETGLIFTTSTENQRLSSFKKARRFFKTFMDRLSYKPSVYKESRNASYYLALLKEFYNEKRLVSIDSENAIEGLLVEVKYLNRSRNKELADQRKENDNYTCQACKFELCVGDIHIIDCHHKNPLSQTNETVTSVEDLVSLCPTCHRIAHLRNPPFLLEEIISILSK